MLGGRVMANALLVNSSWGGAPKGSRQQGTLDRGRVKAAAHLIAFFLYFDPV